MFERSLIIMEQEKPLKVPCENSTFFLQTVHGKVLASLARSPICEIREMDFLSHKSFSFSRLYKYLFLYFFFSKKKCFGTVRSCQVACKGHFLSVLQSRINKIFYTYFTFHWQNKHSHVQGDTRFYNSGFFFNFRCLS